MGSKVVYTGDPAKGPATSQTAPPPLPPPPPYSPAPSTSASAPPAGLRVPCSTSTPFPQELAGPAPLRDLDGSPVWVASALFKDGSVRTRLASMWGGAKKEGGADPELPLPQAVHPCKIARGRVKISYGGVERDHEVREGAWRIARGSPC